MKIKDLLFLTTFKTKPKIYPFAIKRITLPLEGEIFYAQWLHPKEAQKQIRQEDVDELRTFLTPGDVAIDIGAHTGDSTLPIALAVGSKGVVLALEPNPYVFRILEENAKLNQQCTRIIPLNFAATIKCGEFDSYYSDSGFCNGGLHEDLSRWIHFHTHKLRVSGQNLADFLSKEYPDLETRIRYIKVDTEGHDLTILLTLANLISQVRPFIRAEVYRHLSAKQRQDFFRVVTNFGYSIHRIESPTQYIGMRLNESNFINYSHFDIFCVPK